MSFKRRKITLKQLFAGILFACVGLLAISWYFLPTLVEWGVHRMAKDSGIADFSLEVSKLNPWGSELSNFRLKENQSFLEVERIHLLHDPDDLAKGELQAVSVTRLQADFQTKDLVRFFVPERKEEESMEEPFSAHSLLRQFLDDPPLTFVRIRDSSIALIHREQRFVFDFLSKFDLYEGFSKGNLDGILLGAEVLSDFTLWGEENQIFLDGEISFPQLAQLNESLGRAVALLDANQSRVPMIGSGSAVMQAMATLGKEDDLNDLFMEINASDLSVEFGEIRMQSEDLIVFLTPREKDDFSVNSYAHLTVNDEIQVEGANLRMEVSGDSAEIRASVSSLELTDPYPPLRLRGLTLPFWDLNLSESPAFPVGVEKTIHFDEFSFDDEVLKLYQGSLAVTWIEDGGLVSIRVPPLSASMPDLGIAFVDFSYQGLIEMTELPQLNYGQVLSGGRVLVGDEAVVENLSLSFRFKGSQKVLVDSLTASIWGSRMELQPANATIRLDQNQSGRISLSLDGTDLRIPERGLSIEGLRGELHFAQLEPLETEGEQTIFFDRLSSPSMEFLDGNLSFAIQKGEELVLGQAHAKALGGTVSIDSGSLNIYSGSMKVKLSPRAIEGQRVLDLFELGEQKGRVDGSFSGSLQFSNADGLWDFGTGYLELSPSEDSEIELRVFELLTSGLAEGSEEMERMKLTAWALEDLALDSMRINFKVLEKERQILLSIGGVRETDRKKVELKYRPTIIGGLKEIMQWQRKFID